MVLARVGDGFGSAWAWWLRVEQGRLFVHAVIQGGSMMRGRSLKRRREAGCRDGRGNGLPDALVTQQGVQCRGRVCSSVEVVTDPSSLS